MNRKKTIDYTVTRRPRDRNSYNASSAKSRPDSSGRDDGTRDNTPFWSKDNKNLMFNKGKETMLGGTRDLSLQEEISRDVLSQDAKDDLTLFARGRDDSYSRDRVRGPIIDEFSEDAFNSQSGSYSKGMDFRDRKDQPRKNKKTDDYSGRKRSYSPVDEKSSSYKKGREDSQSKRTHSTSSKSHSRNDDDDLRNVLQQFPKTKWDDNDSSVPERTRYDSKGYYQDRKRNSDSLAKPVSSDMFTMSSQGTLVSLPLEPLRDSRDYFDSGFGGDNRDEDRQKGKRGTYSDSSKDRNSRKSKDYSRTRYRSSKQDRRGSLDDMQRDLSNVDNRDSKYRMDKCNSLNDTDMGLSLDPYGEPSNLGNSRLGSAARRDLPLTELAQKSSLKYKTGFELGKPFFGFSSDRQEKDEDHFVDFVSILNQYCQKNRLSLPKYDQAPAVKGSFGMQVFVKGQTFTAMNYCINKKEARHDAAKSALLGLNIPLGPICDVESKRDSVRDQRDQIHQTSKSSTTTPSKTVSSKSKGSTLSTQKQGPKPLFPSGFLPRNLRTPINKNVQKPGVEKNDDIPLLPKKSGYFPRNMQDSRSRSRSSERSDSKKEVGMSNSSSKREVIPPSKGKFTTHNWLGLESNNIIQSKEKDSLITTQPQGRGRGRGNMNNTNRGRGGVFNPRGRGRGFRGRGVGSGGRGRGIMTIRGRGFVFRGRGRGVSQPPVGSTVRNIFRRSKSRSPVDSKYQKESRSSISPRRDRRSRSPRRKERGSRSRSSSFCSTCSSHSCSTCRSWRSVSYDGLSGKGDGDGVRKKKHKTKTSSREEKDRNSAKAVDKLKSDIKNMEKQLEQKPVKSVEEKKRDAAKVNRVTEVSKTDVKDKTKPGKLKDKQSSSKDLLAIKEQNDKNSKEAKKEVKKKTDNIREVILKSDKRKESPKFIKKEKEAPVREVKIVNEKKTKGGKSDEKSGSKMKIDTLKITIDRQEKMPDTAKETKKDRKKDKVEEKPLDTGKRSSRSPTEKQKKKEKVKSKKAKKKSKKRKYDIFSGDSDDDSFYSSISGQDEFSGIDERSRSFQATQDERIVEFSSDGAFDTNSISVHYAKRGKDIGRGNSRKSNNLITIPLPKEPELLEERRASQNIRKPQPREQQFDHPFSKQGKNDSIRSSHYSDLSATMESESGNVDWKTAKIADEFQTEGAIGEQDVGSWYQGSENVNQEWATGQVEEGDPNTYYYEEGAEGEGYEYYSYPQEDWQTGNQEEYEEWYEGEYSQEGAEGETAAGYEGEYYLGEDGLYYPVEGEAYQETQDYHGEYIEGGAQGDVLDAGQGAVYAEAEGEYQYQYSEEGGDWQQYDETVAYQTEEGWNQGEAEGQWQEEYREGYQGNEEEWGTEYTQGNKFEAGEQGYAVQGTEQGYAIQGAEMLPQEGYNAVEGYDQQLAPEEYYMEVIPPQEDGHDVEHGFEFQPQQKQQQQVEPVYSEQPLATKNESKDISVAPSENKVADAKPLKSILKKAKPMEGSGTGTKLVSERLAQMRKQAVNKVETPQHRSSSVASVEKKEQNHEQEGETSVKSESERYREMEEAILSSQPKDAVGTEYVVRVHGSGTANFYCKLCQCHFNTLTAKNLHIKGMKHIELYIRLKSSLLQSVIKDTKVLTAQGPMEDDTPPAQKVPRRF